MKAEDQSSLFLRSIEVEAREEIKYQLIDPERDSMITL